METGCHKGSWEMDEVLTFRTSLTYNFFCGHCISNLISSHHQHISFIYVTFDCWPEDMFYEIIINFEGSTKFCTNNSDIFISPKADGTKKLPTICTTLCNAMHTCVHMMTVWDVNYLKYWLQCNGLDRKYCVGQLHTKNWDRGAARMLCAANYRLLHTL